MKNILVSIILSVSILGSPSAKAETTIFDYFKLSIGLVGGSIASNISKRITRDHPVLSITADCASKLLIGLFYKEATDVLFPHWSERLPDWLKSKKNNPLETENNRLRRELEDLTRAATATNSVIQAQRINQLKEDFIGSLLRETLFHIEPLLQASWLWANNDETALKIARLLHHFLEEVLKQYPGHQTKDAFILVRDLADGQNTGETPLYNEELISKIAEEFHLKRRIPAKTFSFLQENLEKLAKKQEFAKVSYFKRLLNLLDIVLPDAVSESEF